MESREKSAKSLKKPKTLLRRGASGCTVANIAYEVAVVFEVPTLWKSLVLLLRRDGLEQLEETWSPWRFRDILLRADQLCLPMLIIYILLSQLPADYFGKATNRDRH